MSSLNKHKATDVSDLLTTSSTLKKEAVGVIFKQLLFAEAKIISA
jgi:hypothetical protein